MKRPTVTKTAMGCALRKRVPERRATEIKWGAAILIQRWFRRHRAILEARRKSTWTIFQSIEYAGEQNQLKLRDFFNAVLKEFTPTEKDNLNMARIFNKAAADIDGMDTTGLEVEADYDGPHLTFPITTAQVRILLDAFRRNKVLHVRYLLELLLDVRRLLKSRENIHLASTSISKQITVCGDLHGNLEDLVVIFSKNGLPSVHNPYVFNGDFVDRGTQSIEVAAVLFTCFLSSPNSVFLNRGNHEDHLMNCRYGFVKEIGAKYPKTAKMLTKVFADVFSWLPFLTIIDDKVMVVHGGISENTNLKVVSAVNRHRFISVLQPPPLLPNAAASDTSEKENMEWNQLLDLLWSDPRAQSGCVPNTFRGGGCYFGPDISEHWLKAHHLQLLIRSHECKEEGYEYTHNGLVLTIFSASNYYGTGSNKGAYVKLTGGTLQRRIVQYISSDVGKRRMTLTEKVGELESSAMRDLQGKIVASRTALMKKFKAHDPKNTGYIKTKDWCSVMGEVLGQSIPWRLLMPKFATVKEDGTVGYATIFHDLHIVNKFSENEVNVTELLYQYKDSLETIFRLFDQDNSGAITMEEFAEACSIITRHTDINIPPDQIMDLGRSIDLNKDGMIDFNEFLEAFRIVDQEGSVLQTRRNTLQ